MHKKNLLVCLPSYFRKALAFKQPQSILKAFFWLSVNFQAVFKYKREGVSSNCQFCCFSKCLLRFLARPIFLPKFYLISQQYYIGFLFWPYFQAKIERKKRRGEAQWCGVTQQTHEKEQGIKMHFPLLVRRKKIFCKNSFLTIISLSYHFSRKHLLLRRLPLQQSFQSLLQTLDDVYCL